MIAIQDGKFYRNRNGQKIGPMVRRIDPDKWPEFAFAPANAEGAADCYRSNGSWHMTGMEDPHDLVTEWPTGLIRKVSREEIVPGKYGSVIVGRHLTPCWVDIRWSAPGTTVAELRAAVTVLTELADARERGVGFAQDGEK